MKESTGSTTVLHHGATTGVTGSCHELRLPDGAGILVDCGLFQGAETSPGGRSHEDLGIDFPVDHVAALVVTHVHIDHVGRIPHLFAAGYRGPIYCSQPSARLLPLVMEDALAIGVTRDRDLIALFLQELQRRLRPLPYGQWTDVGEGGRAAVRLQPAGHILGSAFVELRVGSGGSRQKYLFSGDLGAPWSPLLPAPRPPWGADVVVLESTYGDRLHQGRRERRQALRRVLEHALSDGGTVVVPAFSIGRTQELLYELEQIIHDHADHPVRGDLPWRDLDIVIDSPLASRFTQTYRELRPFWDREARRRAASGRHPLSFEQLTTIPDHAAHERAVDYLANSHRPAVVLAASGMCAGGRVVNYLKAMLGDPRHDILFVGYQARGTPGHAIQEYGPKGGYVRLDGESYDIRASVTTIPGYSAHADRGDLIRFVRGMRRPPREIRLVHGDPGAKEALRVELRRLLPDAEVWIPGE